MDLRQLRSFATVVEQGSINRAAQHLRCAQPSISTQMKQLEAELGVELLERRTRGIEPTAAGRRFYDLSIEILGKAEHARQTMSGWGQSLSGNLVAGIIPTLSKSALPRFLPAYAEEFPNISLRIVEAYSGTLMGAVLEGEIDFAIVITPRREGSLELRKLSTDVLTVISGRKSLFAPGEPVVLSELKPLKLVIPSHRHSLRAVVEQLADSGDITIERTVEIDGLYGTLQFLRNSDWSALLPRMTVADETDDPGFTVSPIVKPVMSFGYYLIHQKRRPLSAAAQALVERLSQVLGDYE